MSTWGCDTCTFINEEESLTCVMCYQVRTSTRALPYTWQWLAEVDWIPYDAPSNDQIEVAYQAKKDHVALSKGWFASKKGEYTVCFTTKAAPATSSGWRARGGAAAAMAAAIAERESRHEDEDDDEGDVADDASMASASPAPPAISSGSGTEAAASSVPVAAPAPIPAFVQTNSRSGMRRKVRRLANDDDTMFTPVPPSQTARGEKCNICAEEWWEMEDEEEAPATPRKSEAAADASATVAESDSASATAMDTLLSPKKSAAPSAPAAATDESTAATASASHTSSSVRASSTASSVRETCLALHPSDSWPVVGESRVQLAKCRPGHAFHRDCIAGWIKIKDHCPVCKIKV